MYSYRYHEIADLFDIHPNVIPRWIKDGLRRIDDQRPYLVHGSDLAAYLTEKQKSRKRPCKSGEIYCCKCRCPRAVWEGVADLIVRNKKTLLISALCSVCETPVIAIGSIAKIAKYEEIFKIQRLEEPSIIDSNQASVKCELKQG